MAAAAIQTTFYPTSAPRRHPCWTGTPEIYFTKAIDNSRLVKVEDPRRAREMRQFGVALDSQGSFARRCGFDQHRSADLSRKNI